MSKKRALSWISGVLAAAMLITATACNKSEDGDEKEQTKSEVEVVPLSVQIMSREANQWAQSFAGDTIEIMGDGEYSGRLNIPGEYTVFPNIAISAVGTDTEDRIGANAEPAPDGYISATVDINSVSVNGKPLVLENNTDVLLVPDDGPLIGYANVQLWNAWFQPNQRINADDSDGVEVTDMGGDFLKFEDSVRSIEVEFTVSNYGGEVQSKPETDETDENDEEEDDDDEPLELSPPFDVIITGEFDKEITSEQLVGNIGAGWNLGNTFDAYCSEDPGGTFHWVDYDDMIQVETAWVGIENATTYTLIKRIKELGFDSIRIPVTWYKMAGEAPDYIIREDWMSRVQEVVDMAVAEDMYIILNTHHDEYIMRFDEDPAVGEQAVKALWTQIGERFRDYNEKLIFEGLNEPRARTNSWDTHGQWNWGGDEEKYIVINRWNQAFVNAVRATGGNNEYRHLMLATYGAQSYGGAIGDFVLPNDPVSENGISRFIWSIHVYSPHNWAHNGNGSYEGESAVRNDIERVAERAAELNIPVIFGEWGSVTRLDSKQRIQHAYDYMSVATSMRERSENPVVMACFWWDNAGDFSIVKRNGKASGTGKDIIDAILRAREGQPLNG